MTNSLAVARIGSQRPRLEHYPAFFTSAADDVVDLAEIAGIVLDPWQEYVLRRSLGERPDGRWSAFRTCVVVPRQNGKNVIIEARELGGLFLFNEKVIVHTAHQYKTARESMMSMMARIRGCELIEHVQGFDLADWTDDDGSRLSGLKTGNAPGVTLKNNNRLIYAARSKGSGRGFTGDVIVLDEAYALDLEEMAALLPTMAARSIEGNPQIWFTSSAGMEGSTLLASLRKQGKEKRGDRLAYFEWSADTSAASDDLDAWYEANPGLGIRISEEFVQDEMETFLLENNTDEQWRRERLGIWDEDSITDIFGGQWAAKCLDMHPVAPRLEWVGIAVSIDLEWAAIVARGTDANGRRVVRPLAHGRGIAWVPEKAEELAQVYKVPAVVDQKGPASILLPMLRSIYGKRLHEVDTPQVLDAVDGIRQAIALGQMSHAGYPELDNAVKAAVLRDVGDRSAFGRRKSSGDISALEAATLADWAAENLRPEITPPPDIF